MPVNHRRAIRTTKLLEHLFVEERRCLEIIPNAFGEKPVLKLILGSLRSPACGFTAITKAAVRWWPIKVTAFERRQMDTAHADLDQE